MQQPPHPPVPPLPPYAPIPVQTPKKPKRWIFGLGVLILALAVCGLCSLTTNTKTSSSQADTSNDSADPTPTTTGSHMVVSMTSHSPTAVVVHPTATPMLVQTPKSTPQSIHYPPTTLADLHSLATKGVASAIHEFHSESVGLTGVCPQPKREVTVDPGVSGQQLAEDLLAYFYTQQLDSPCGSVVFAYHDQGEANDAYTAGRISVDVTDSSGTDNIDPNASSLTHKLTLDVGGLDVNQEYVVTY